LHVNENELLIRREENTLSFNTNSKCVILIINLEILKETVLDPIEEGVLGGKFAVLDNDCNVQFSLSNTSDKSVHCNFTV
jgi:hypothetical protein